MKIFKTARIIGPWQYNCVAILAFENGLYLTRDLNGHLGCYREDELEGFAL